MNHKSKNTIRMLCDFWLPVFFWMSIIFYFSSKTRVVISNDNVINFVFFKSLHVGEYGLLFVLLYRAIRNTYHSFASHVVGLTAFLITLCYAATDEYHQLFVPTREGRVRDVIIDAGGAIAAWMILRIILPIIPKKLQFLAKKLDLM